MLLDAVGAKEKHEFFHPNDGCFIPGYTGHCPTLRFQYGTPYGTKTNEILQDLKQKNVIKRELRKPYRFQNQHDKEFSQRVEKQRPQAPNMESYEVRRTTPKYIMGYTGFIPTYNFRYGKSYSRTADDSMCDFASRQRRLEDIKTAEANKFRSQSAPKYTSIRNKDDVKYVLVPKYSQSYIDKFKIRDVSPEHPPISGYTGYVPKVKGNEESLSQRYNNVVRRSLTLVREERERMRQKYGKAQISAI